MDKCEIEQMLDNIALYFPTLVMKLESVMPALDPDELILILENGDKVLYNDTNNSVRNLPSDIDNMSEYEFKREFGIRLKKLMNKKGITQEELSEITEITRPMISNYIRGKSLPTFYNMDRIAKALDCSTEEFRHI